ncbi:hypothetical protein CCACVL1_01196 [Corchorus capsularis]|uniref:Uncharacterized protein n=1 Tax=Corchorus capsularis TaxID=210143 RepID=A0A1R3KLD7_COCAP|nr:hypothetical protein CCACVL1_01196 [Corchorus capsularis]
MALRDSIRMKSEFPCFQQLSMIFPRFSKKLRIRVSNFSRIVRFLVFICTG